jgi:hypothetical protein
MLRLEMRIFVALMLGLFLAATAYAASGSGGSSSPHRARLTVDRGTVHGSRFAQGERVTIRITAAGERVTRRIQASAAGSFATQLPYHDPCLGSILVVARGASGDRASLKLPQKACAPAD